MRQGPGDHGSYSWPVPWLPDATVVHLHPGSALLLVAVGAAAGIVNGLAGGGTLIAFPVLLALGYPALTSNVTCTVGLWSGYTGGMAGFKVEVVEQRKILRVLAIPSAVGAVVGSILLLTTPPSGFERAAPWLVLAASLLFAAQPLVARMVRRRATEGRPRHHGVVAGTFLASIYGGYFGAGLGVILLAVLGLTLNETVARSSALRTVLSVLANGVAALAFIVAASVAWEAAGLLAIGALVGGFLGARLVRRLSPTVLRVVVVLFGLATTIKLLS
jgi:uncharacterized protein